MSRPYAEVIGDPVDHSKSPLIHNFWLAKLGIDAEYRATRVTRDDLPAYLAARLADPAWRGCNVTMPLKEQLTAHLSSTSGEAQGVGAVNCIVRRRNGLHGLNTDVDGMRVALRAATCREDELIGLTAVLIGAGGAARAALYVLNGERIGHVHVMNRSMERAEALLREFAAPGQAGPLGEVPENVAMLVNASSLGMAGMPPLSIDIGSLPADAGVVDMVYAPAETALLADARRRGLKCADGLTMLVGQAGSAFRAFFGLSPPRDDEAELRALLLA